MNARDIGQVFARAEDSFERAIATSAKTGRTLARADDVMARVGAQDSAARAAARRERTRLNAGLGRTVRNVALVVLGVWIATMVIGFVQPIGIFGLIIAIAAAVLLAGVTIAGSQRSVRPALPSPDLPNAMLVDRLDSYLYRARPALPPPAQAEVDAMLARLPELRPALEKAEALDPNVQDARRLMGTHLPNLIDRYMSVPASYRSGSDDGDVSIDQRLVDALRAGREALDDAGVQLAKGNVAAFETQGRFIESRYGEKDLDRS